MCLLCLDKKIPLDDLPLEEYKKISPVFEEDIYEAISLKTCVNKRIQLVHRVETMQEAVDSYKKYMRRVLEGRHTRWNQKLRVGILGATGMVGQRFIALLENHPWFEVVTVAASPRSAGKTYEEAVGDRWKMDTPMPEGVKKLIVANVNEVEKVASSVDFVFSAVDMTKDEIRAIEEAYAKTETPVVSNNSAHRWTKDVPMVVPEINSDHFELINDQRKRLGTTRGFIAVKPNCSIQSYTPCLAAWKEFGPKEVVATTYQAISGAGKTFKEWPEMVENIIPYIGGEEEKSEQEPLRVLGTYENGQITLADAPKITCQCLRVPVLNGHTAAVFINFEKKPTKEQLIEKLESFKGFPQEAGLPSAPKQFVRYWKRITVHR